MSAHKVGGGAKAQFFVGLTAALVLGGCSLESALGVGDDESSSGTPPAMTSTVPGTDSSADSTGGADASTDGGSVDSTDSGPTPSSCEGQAIRIATFNVESVGEEGGDSFEALVDTLMRIDADVVCLQEVQEWETTRLFALGTAAGYPDVIQANPPPAIGGEHTNACLGRVDLRIQGSYGGSDLSSDAQANDVGRDILVVQANLAAPGEPPCRLGLVALHLKSGQDSLDWFRRQIEVERVAQAIALYRAEFPGDAMAIVGDLNENIGDPALGTVFNSAPTGLPDSYHLGSDISFPLTYEPFVRLSGLGFTIADATQEDSGAHETWADLVRLDYVMVAEAELVADEVYNACRDNGVDDPPKGDFMTKAGEPLTCGVSEDASDHFPVMADILLP